MQYLRLQMRYNIDRSNIFIAYRNTSLADSEDVTNWRNARASKKVCMTCVKRNNMCLRWVIDTYGDANLGACVWCQERSVRCSIIAQQGRTGKSLGEKRKRSEKGKEKAEGTSDEDESLDEEPLVKKAKVSEVVVEDTPPPVPEYVKGKVQQHNEVEDRVEGEAEQPQVVEGLGQGVREVRPDEAALVVALWELTKVCWQGFDDMREGLAKLYVDSWILLTAAVDYLQERKRKNLNWLGNCVQEQEESSNEGSKCNKV